MFKIKQQLKPKISIITVNYNNLAGLQKTMQSVASQTWQEFEYIIIDGGSTDGSLKYIESNAHLVHYWVSEPDRGVYHAMNKGIAKATGEYLLFLNSGDHFFSKEVLRKNEQAICNYDLIYFNQLVVGEAKKFVKQYPATLSFAYFLKDNLPHQATFVKKEIFSKVGLFKEDFKIVADWKFFIDSICKYHASYRYVDKTLITFYLGGISSNPESHKIIHEEKQQVLKADYQPYLQGLEDVLKYMSIVTSLRRSRIIKTLIRFGLLNKF